MLDPKTTWRHPYGRLVRLQETRKALRYQLIKHRTSITQGYLVKSNPLSTCAYMSHTANFVLRLRNALINDSRPDHNRHVVIDSTGISQGTGNGVTVLFSNCIWSFEPGVTQNAGRSNAEKNSVQYQRWSNNILIKVIYTELKAQRADNRLCMFTVSVWRFPKLLQNKVLIVLKTAPKKQRMIRIENWKS